MSTQDSMRKKLQFALKLGVSLVLSGVIIYYFVDIDVFLDNVNNIRWSFFAIPLVAYFGIIFFISLRWYYIMQSLNMPLPLSTILGLYFKHNLVNQVSPGSIVGDGYRIEAVKRLAGYSRTDLLSSVIFERVSGLTTKLILLSFFSIYFWRTFDISSVTLPNPSKIALFGLAALAVLTTLFFVARKKLLKILKNFKVFVTNTQLIVISVLLSVIVQVVQIISAYGVVLMLQLPINLFEIGLVFIIIEFLMLIPISVNGWGTREIVMIVIFSYFGVESNSATLYALVSRAVYTLLTTLGIPFFLYDVIAKGKEPLNHSHDSNNTQIER